MNKLKLGRGSLLSLGIILKIFFLWLVATFVLFLLIETLPGDAASNIAGKRGEEAVIKLRQEMGLYRPISERYSEWLFGIFRGDLSHSLITKRPVADIIKTPLISSLSIAGIVFLCLLFVSIPLSLYAAYYNNFFSKVLSRLSVIIASVPEFITTLVLIMLFCMKLNILPVLSQPGPGKNVWEVPISLVMPSLCMWMISHSSMFRHMKVMIEGYVRSDFVREARLSGLTNFRILFIHLLPSALSGIAQLLASTVPYLLGGGIIIETLTSFPGMGYTLISAVQKRDTPIVMGISAIIIALSIVSYFLADQLSKGRKYE